jgi:hypothetical protein
MNGYLRQNTFMQPQLPTGVPAGPGFMPVPVAPQQFVPQQFQTFPGAQQLQPMAAAPLLPPVTGPAPQTTDNILYTPGYLRTQLGRRVKVEFLIGTNLFVDREGILVAVGATYIIIQEAETDDLLLCDMFSIKFVKFYY